MHFSEKIIFIRRNILVYLKGVLRNCTLEGSIKSTSRIPIVLRLSPLEELLEVGIFDIIIFYFSNFCVPKLDSKKLIDMSI